MPATSLRRHPWLIAATLAAGCVFVVLAAWWVIVLRANARTSFVLETSRTSWKFRDTDPPELKRAIEMIQHDPALQLALIERAQGGVTREQLCGLARIVAEARINEPSSVPFSLIRAVAQASAFNPPHRPELELVSTIPTLTPDQASEIVSILASHAPPLDPLWIRGTMRQLAYLDRSAWPQNSVRQLASTLRQMAPDDLGMEAGELLVWVKHDMISISESHQRIQSLLDRGMPKDDPRMAMLLSVSNYSVP